MENLEKIFQTFKISQVTVPTKGIYLINGERKELDAGQTVNISKISDEPDGSINLSLMLTERKVSGQSNKNNS